MKLCVCIAGGRQCTGLWSGRRETVVGAVNCGQRSEL